MKTIDGVEFQDGMRLYRPSWSADVCTIIETPPLVIRNNGLWDLVPDKYYGDVREWYSSHTAASTEAISWIEREIAERQRMISTLKIHPDYESPDPCMDWISLDLETTGLDCDVHQTIDVGAITRSGQAFRCLVWHPQYTIDPACFGMHEEYWKLIGSLPPLKEESEFTNAEYQGGNVNIVRAKYVQKYFYLWLGKCGITGRWNLAGKNPQFDCSFLNKLMPRLRYRRRLIDPSILFRNESDEALPTLEECCKRAGIESHVEHTGLADAKMVRLLLLTKGW